MATIRYILLFAIVSVHVDTSPCCSDEQSQVLRDMISECSQGNYDALSSGFEAVYEGVWQQNRRLLEEQSGGRPIPPELEGNFGLKEKHTTYKYLYQSRKWRLDVERDGRATVSYTLVNGVVCELHPQSMRGWVRRPENLPELTIPVALDQFGFGKRTFQGILYDSELNANLNAANDNEVEIALKPNAGAPMTIWCNRKSQYLPIRILLFHSDGSACLEYLFEYKQVRDEYVIPSAITSHLFQNGKVWKDDFREADKYRISRQEIRLKSVTMLEKDEPSRFEIEFPRGALVSDEIKKRFDYVGGEPADVFKSGLTPTVPLGRSLYIWLSIGSVLAMLSVMFLLRLRRGGK